MGGFSVVYKVGFDLVSRRLNLGLHSARYWLAMMGYGNNGTFDSTLDCMFNLAVTLYLECRIVKSNFYLRHNRGPSSRVSDIQVLLHMPKYTLLDQC